MKFTSGLVFAVLFAIEQVRGDVYMHAPRGSNNRNCRTDNNKERRNGNRVFDSQNNDNGGYSCPRAAPFDCYKYVDNNGQFQQCANRNNNNPNGSKKNHLDAAGRLTNPQAVNTDTLYYYEGSTVPISWTAQHGMGANDELYSELVIQYACEDTLQDTCGNTPAGQSPYVVPANAANVCTMRDGTPVRVQDGNNGLNAEATNRIPDDQDDQDDMRYGRHETYAFYQECKNRERNKGLWISDQNLNGNDARYTRQNPNANRNGLECPEESEYYPYWHYSPWKDVAVVADSTARCALIQSESQNVKPKGRCECNGACNGNGNQPNNPAACAQVNGATWVEDPAHGLAAPECFVGEYSRQNHLGNSAGSAQALNYNWTVPALPQNVQSMKCTLRIRYNMSSADKGTGTIEAPRDADASLNGDNGPLYDNDENEAKTYMDVVGMPGAQLGFAVNTNQFGRTFQDRTYAFEIKRRPNTIPAAAKIHNLNVRGKRGNIVQAYPAVEYDFVPSDMVVNSNDYVHVQWTGSDYNPNRDGNNGEGGPYASDNRNKDTTADRYNMVQMNKPGDNFPGFDSNAYTMFGAGATNQALYTKLMFLDQNINSGDCLNFAQLDQQFDNRDEREETHLNCMKLSGSKTPHFDAGPLQVGGAGTYHYMSTRNNNLSNRGQQGKITVVGGARLNSDGGVDGAAGASSGTDSLPMILGAVGAAVVGIGGFTVYKKRQNQGATTPQPQQQQQQQQGAAQVASFNPGYSGR